MENTNFEEFSMLKRCWGDVLHYLKNLEGFLLIWSDRELSMVKEFSRFFAVTNEREVDRDESSERMKKYGQKGKRMKRFLSVVKKR